jgi:hypothetical protein
MKYLDVRIRVPTSKLGQLVDLLPDWAPMVGYDKLEEVEKPRRFSRSHVVNGKFNPAKGSTAAAVLEMMKDKPMRGVEVIQALEGKFADRAVSSAFYMLRNRGLIKKQKDGNYVITKR